MNEAIAHLEDIPSIFAVLTLHFDNLGGFRMLLCITTEVQLATTRKKNVAQFLERTKEEQTILI